MKGEIRLCTQCFILINFADYIYLKSGIYAGTLIAIKVALTIKHSDVKQLKLREKMQHLMDFDVSREGSFIIFVSSSACNDQM